MAAGYGAAITGNEKREAQKKIKVLESNKSSLLSDVSQLKQEIETIDKELQKGELLHVVFIKRSI